MKRWNNQEHGYNDIKTLKSKGFNNQIQLLNIIIQLLKRAFYQLDKNRK